MSTPTPPLRTARVLRVSETGCEVWSDGAATSVGFAPMFPSPRVERVSPGHLVAIATGPHCGRAAVWRWYDAVVLGPVEDGSAVLLWEPAHGEVRARLRSPDQTLEPGSRVWASAGLPGAQWWIACPAHGDAETADVELDEVDALFTEAGLWTHAFDT